MWFEIKTILSILIILLIPGWTILAVSGYWKRWEPLQRWFLAISLSVAFYPVLFYSARFVLPQLQIGRYKLALLLIIFMGLVVWKFKDNWREHFQIGKWNFLILGILIATIYTRLLPVHLYPYLAGDDSLHHTLLTEMTAESGKLPNSLAPYDPVTLEHYHLGLYALTAPLKMLADIPADKALLWMAQFLNGLCGIGVFLFLEKKVSRFAGIIGMVVAGLISPFPAWYINWGRFTQLSAQMILLPAIIVTWDLVSNSLNPENEQKDKRYTYLLIAALINAGVCLLHFRVAMFMLPLTLTICIFELFNTRRVKKTTTHKLVNIAIIGGLTLLIILPTLIPGLNAYIDKRAISPAEQEENIREPLEASSYYSIGEPDTIRISNNFSPVYYVGIVGLLLGMLRKDTRAVSLITAIWVIVLLLEAYAYKLDIPVLAFTNITAVLLVLYLPLSIALGIFVDSIDKDFITYSNKTIDNYLLFLMVLLGFAASFSRVDQFERRRAFMTDEDVKAMEWVKNNTPKDALFAVNTAFLNPRVPYGTDAGYWLPFYGQRPTTALTLMATLSTDYEADLARSKSILTLYSSDPKLDSLCQYGIDYVYSGVKNPLGSADFDIKHLSELDGVSLVYDVDGVQILKICD